MFSKIHIRKSANTVSLIVYYRKWWVIMCLDYVLADVCNGNKRPVSSFVMTDMHILEMQKLKNRHVDFLSWKRVYEPGMLEKLRPQRFRLFAPDLFGLNQASFHSGITDRLDVILVIYGRRNNTPSFLHMERKSTRKKIPPEQLMGLANFILPQESMYMLLLSHIHLSFSLARLYSCLRLQCFQVEVCFTYGSDLIHHLVPSVAAT